MPPLGAHHRRAPDRTGQAGPSSEKLLTISNQW
jgi:hypothetical protein